MRFFDAEQSRRGFSLIELLVAMVLLAIGILATMAMQISTLKGYTAARETTGSSEIARTTEQIIRAEARDWNAGNNAEGGSFQDPYSDQAGIFEQLMSNPGNWQRVYAEPVTQRYNGESVDPNGPDDSARRFCVYAVGQEVASEAPSAGQTPDYVRVGMAVIYPTGEGRFDDGCPTTDNISLNSGDRTDLELEGYRATHYNVGMRATNSQFK